MSNMQTSASNVPVRNVKLLRLPDVAKRVCRGKSTIYQMISEGRFPAPIKQGSGNYWLDTEIDDYLRTLIAERQSNLQQE